MTNHASNSRIAGKKLSKPIAQRISQVREGLPISELNTLANVLRISRVLLLATEVLGSEEKASRWLTAASRPLEGQPPLQLLDTDIGTQRVEQELYQIKFGIPA